MSIVVVDYCKGNLASVQRGLIGVGFETVVSDTPDDILAADGIVLPGVGNFGDASRTLVETGQMEALRTRVLQDGVPFLGICLGLQLLLASGEEGSTPPAREPGLGAFAGRVVRLDDTDGSGHRVKIPHVGWNSIEIRRECPLLEGIPDGSYFYFTHSYCALPDDDSIVVATTTHATDFPSVIWKENLFGTQFHPEKSSRLGLTVLTNFGAMVKEHG